MKTFWTTAAATGDLPFRATGAANGTAGVRYSRGNVLVGIVESNTQDVMSINLFLAADLRI